MNEMTKVQSQPEYSEKARKALAREPKLFINGGWVESSHDKTIPIIDPSNGREIARMADASDKDVDRAVAAARIAFDDGRWTGLPPIVREGMIMRLADLLEQNAAEFSELEAIDNGKPMTMAGGIDTPGAIAMLRYMAGWATKLASETSQPAAIPSGLFHAYVRREPV